MDAAALQESWRCVLKVREEASGFFYAHLFLTHPELRAMFPISMAAQRDRFFTALGRMVADVDRLSVDGEFVAQLGRDHRRFEVAAAHYPPVGASLLATLQNFLGAAWTETLASHWAQAYGQIAQIMIVAAEDAEDHAPPFWQAEVLAVERRGLDVAVLQLAPEPAYPYRAGQSLAVQAPAAPRMWRYYSPATAPRPDGTLELHVQIVPGGQVSTALARRTKPGELLHLGAPVGERLTVPDTLDTDLVLVAGGTGLAPLAAVLDQVAARWQRNGTGPAVHLLHGVKMAWDLYDHARLTALAAAAPWLTYTPVISEDPSYLGHRGLVGSVAATAVGDPASRTALVCGPAAMVAHARTELAAAGMSAAAVRAEDFTAAADTEFDSFPEPDRAGDAAAGGGSLQRGGTVTSWR